MAIALKVLLWSLAPTYGLAASYFPRARFTGPPERSTEHRFATYTRIEQQPGQPDFALHFFNDVERFNYYEPPDPDRTSLPFAVRYEGYIYPPGGETTTLIELTATGVAILSIDSAPFLTVGGRGGTGTERASVALSPGGTPIQLEYVQQGGGDSWLSMVVADDWGVFTIEPVSAARLQLDGYLRVLAIALDLLLLAGIVGAGVVASIRRTRRAQLGTPFAWERPLIAVLLLVVLGYALVTTAPLAGRSIILEGGQDWLTYESYARDILIGGPLMTLGEPLGKGKPFFFQPFYPYYLAGMHWLTGEGLWGPIVLQLFGVGVAGVYVYYLAKRLFGVGAAMAALAIFLVLGLSQVDWIARKLLSENLYFIVLPAALLYLTRAIDERRLSDVAWSGLLFGVATITRAPTILLIPGAALVLAVAWRRAGATLPRAAIALVLLGLVTAAVAALVPIRNYIVAGRPALVATNGGATLLLAHQPTSKVQLRGVDRDPLYNALKLDRATREVVEFVRQDPVGYAWTLVPLALYAVGIPRGIEGQPEIAYDVLAITATYVVAVALLPAARTLRTLPLHIFIAIHFAIMVTFLPYVYGYRQVLPMQELMLVFDGALLAGLIGRIGRWRQSARPDEPVVQHGAA